MAHAPSHCCTQRALARLAFQPSALSLFAPTAQCEGWSQVGRPGRRAPIVSIRARQRDARTGGLVQQRLVKDRRSPRLESTWNPERWPSFCPQHNHSVVTFEVRVRSVRRSRAPFIHFRTGQVPRGMRPQSRHERVAPAPRAAAGNDFLDPGQTNWERTGV